MNVNLTIFTYNMKNISSELKQDLNSELKQVLEYLSEKPLQVEKINLQRYFLQCYNYIIKTCYM